MDNEYKLDPDLDAVLREQMIEGGVPENEIQPSIDDIEEAMDERIDRKDDSNGRITNMEDNTRTGADILNTPSETPRYDAPFEQPEETPVDGEYTDEEYASVPQEVNDQIINLIREMRAAGTPMPEIMRHAREIIEAWISSNRRVAYTEGGNWYHGGEGNWCEDCVNAGSAPGDVKPVGPLAENVQIACSGCGEQEGMLNREFGRDLVEKMPQEVKVPGLGSIPFDVVRERKRTPGAPDTAERKEFRGSSVEVERTTMPSEHLGWYEKTANELESSYYTVRLTGENVAIIKGALRVLANQIGGAEAAQIQNALEALETAEYDVSGSGLGDIPTLPEEPER